MSAMPGKVWTRTFEAYGDDIRELGRRFGDARRRKGMTQREVAAEMCSAQSRVCEVEAGNSDPRYSTMIRYADAIGCDLRVELIPRG